MACRLSPASARDRGLEAAPANNKIGQGMDNLGLVNLTRNLQLLISLGLIGRRSLVQLAQVRALGEETRARMRLV